MRAVGRKAMHKMNAMAGHQLKSIEGVFLNHIHKLSNMTLATCEGRATVHNPLRAFNKLSAVVLPVIEISGDQWCHLIYHVFRSFACLELSSSWQIFPSRVERCDVYRVIRGFSRLSESSPVEFKHNLVAI